MNMFIKYKILKELRTKDIEILKEGKRNWIEYLVQAKKDNCEKWIIKQFRCRIDILSRVIAEKETEKEIEMAMVEFKEKDTDYIVSDAGYVKKRKYYC